SELSTGISYVGPRNEVERQLIKVWEGVLGKQGIGIRDNFFGLGGDSIKSIQVVSRLKQEGYSVKLGDILSYTSIAELSGFVTEIDQEIDQSEVLGAVLLTPIQHYFFSNPLNKVLTHYNQSVLLKSTKEISIDILDQTLSLLVGHHDVLRMSYKEQDNNWHQFNGGIKVDHYSVVFHDLRGSADGLSEMGVLSEGLQSSFDLSGPLFKIGHFRLADGDRILLIIHHLLVDGVSWRILLEDLSNLYGQIYQGLKVSLPLKTDSFQRWSLLLSEYSKGKDQESERSYWSSLEDVSIALFPKDIITSRGSVLNIDSGVSFTLDSFLTGILQSDVHQVYNTEINDILIS